MIRQTVQSNLIRYRESKNKTITMDEMARACGMSRIEYSRLEKGLETIDIIQLEKFACVLNVKVIDLVEEW